MSTKQEPGDFDCYKRALQDEPMFVLLARDPVAPALVEMWAQQRSRDIDRGTRPGSDGMMVLEAMECARNMREWRVANDGKWRTATAAEAEPSAAKTAKLQDCIDLVFQMTADGVSPFPAYVELFTGDGKISLKVGEWIRRNDGSMALRITREEAETAARMQDKNKWKDGPAAAHDLRPSATEA